MIRVQPTSSDSQRFLIGSDLSDTTDAAQEVQTWLEHNGCVIPDSSRRLAVYEDGILVREWVLAERVAQTQEVPVADPMAAGNSNLFLRFWQRRNNTGEPAASVRGLSETIVLHFAEDVADEDSERVA
ncbi:MAG: hypothetical protein OHK0029_20160 [Armatimonadaceae bacterium]